MSDVRQEFAPVCPRCDKPMAAVVAEGLLGFQRAVVPAFKCDCRATTYPVTSEVELQGWVAVVTLEGGPSDDVVGVGEADGSITMDFARAWLASKRAGPVRRYVPPDEGVPVCRECDGELQEGGNPHEDGWYCPECMRFDLNPARRVEVPGFGTVTSKHPVTWPAMNPEEREIWLQGAVVAALEIAGLPVDAECLNEPRAFTRAVGRLARVLRMIEENGGNT